MKQMGAKRQSPDVKSTFLTIFHVAVFSIAAVFAIKRFEWTNIYGKGSLNYVTNDPSNNSIFASFGKDLTDSTGKSITFIAFME